MLHTQGTGSRGGHNPTEGICLEVIGQVEGDEPVIEAGNVRFGLEMRTVGADGGPA